MGLKGNAEEKLRRRAGKESGEIIREVLEGRKLRLMEHRRLGGLMDRLLTAALQQLKEVVELALIVTLISRF